VHLTDIFLSELFETMSHIKELNLCPQATDRRKRQSITNFPSCHVSAFFLPVWRELSPQHFFFSALVQPAGKYNTINLYNLNQELLEKGEDNDTEKGKRERADTVVTKNCKMILHSSFKVC
jgi:hypothetical protein